METSGDLQQHQCQSRGVQWRPVGTSTITRSSQQEQGPQLEQEWELQGQSQ